MSEFTKKVERELDGIESRMGWGRDAPSDLDLILSLLRLVRSQNEAIQVLEDRVRALEGMMPDGARCVMEEEE
jgi:hypothetical protein